MMEEVECKLMVAKEINDKLLLFLNQHHFQTADQYDFMFVDYFQGSPKCFGRQMHGIQNIHDSNTKRSHPENLWRLELTD